MSTTDDVDQDEVVSRSVAEGDMIVEWDVPIVMDDGIVLRADVYRPRAQGSYPTLMSHGPYGKGLSWADAAYRVQWESLIAEHPDVLEGSSGKYQSWETVDPEKWVPYGYAIVRIDSRGAGRSPGFLDPWSRRETQDFHDCIEWAAEQPWSNGKVGLAGISYFAYNQWLVAATHPRHLAAICPWEGLGDWYRDATRHGGVPTSFLANWIEKQLAIVQHGMGDRGGRNENSGELAAGPPTLSDEELVANRIDLRSVLYENELDAEFARERSVNWSEIDLPLLSAVNWGGQGLHPRGGYAGFTESASSQKWLEVHGLEHWTLFYTSYGLELQRRFFDHFLKGDDNGWGEQPPVLLQIRHVDRFEQRAEHEWPLARTRWTKLYLDVESGLLSQDEPAGSASRAFEAIDEKLVFLTDPFETETEITGPLAAKLFVGSSTSDADIFLVVHLISPDGREITFAGAVDAHTPVGQGWLRASHRKLDPVRTKPWQPYHPHDEIEPLTPGETYEVDVEIIPTCIVIPADHRLGLSVRGSDYVFEGNLTEGTHADTWGHQLTGCGPFVHNDPVTRPLDLYGGTTTIHSGGSTPSFVLLPVIDR